jgi:3-hydroxy-3-methylglutaryl CoA synthase
MIGLVSYGGYIPRLRLPRKSIVQSMGWFTPALIAVAQGERAFCNWDEDALTMAVAAARDCLAGLDKQKVDALYLGSTSLPYGDRQNAGILGTALNLREDIFSADVTGSQKAGTGALLSGLEAVKAGDRRTALVAASDKRETKASWFHEMWFGDAAASLLVGKDNVIAEFKGSHSISCDFVDHFRDVHRKFDYAWEERWIRDLGYSQILPAAIKALLDKTGVAIGQVSKLAYPCYFKREHADIGKKLGAKPEQLVDNLHEVMGESGVAHPLVQFIAALEGAKPGDKIVLASFGQGCDALLFEVTDAIAKLPARRGVKGSLANRNVVENYAKFLKFRDLINTEMGIRAEADRNHALTVLWRKRKMILGLVGGRCQQCGTRQFPKTEICVNPDCHAYHRQEDCEFADTPAVVKTFTGDLLAVSVDPPAVYGLVQFSEGGRMMADFTDCELKDLKVGQPVSMSFRRRHHDEKRGFTGYFWKAVPQR